MRVSIGEITNDVAVSGAPSPAEAAAPTATSHQPSWPDLDRARAASDALCLAHARTATESRRGLRGKEHRA